ncbi:MAG: OmpA family protein [Paracoccaceae bacterium]
MIQKPVAVLIATLGLAACAGPDLQTPIAEADSAVSEALRADAGRLSPGLVDSAQENLATARLLAEEGEDEEALLAAERARADANEATALARASQASAARSEAELLAERNAALTERLRELEAEVTERGTVVTLGDVLFETDQAALTAAGRTRVARIAAYLRTNPGEAVVIEGHADARGSARYNLDLSEARAASVADALLAEGVATPRIVYTGAGESSPIAPNATPAGRQLNRRVEVIFVDRG